MADVIVIGGGAAGLGAALFTAKFGMDTVVFDTDDSRMHAAYLYNYLGIDEISGTEFLKIARRQVEKYGAALRAGKVTRIQQEDGRFVVETEDGGREDGKYLVIATGLDASLLKALGVEFDGDEAKVDRHGQTSAENVYAVGWAARSASQAVISAGDGAAAAIHLIAKETGRPYKDFDVPPSDKA